MIASLKNNIKNHLLGLYAQKWKRLRVKKAIVANVSTTVPTIGFLYTVEPGQPQKTEAILRAIEQLKTGGKRVQVLGYLPNSQQINPNNFFYFFTREDINLLGKSKKNELNDFLKTQFEHLYHIDIVSEPILDYIVASSNAKCKIGNFIAGRDYLFEITFKGLVEADKNINFDSLIDKMLSYTKMLKV